VRWIAARRTSTTAGLAPAQRSSACVHPRIHGHTDLNSRTPSSGGAMSDEQKAERRTVVANKEAWRSAEKVRRAWLRDFLTRRTRGALPPMRIRYSEVDGGLDRLRGLHRREPPPGGPDGYSPSRPLLVRRTAPSADGVGVSRTGAGPCRVHAPGRCCGAQSSCTTGSPSPPDPRRLPRLNWPTLCRPAAARSASRLGSNSRRPSGGAGLVCDRGV
jgi:hypothetical protein